MSMLQGKLGNLLGEPLPASVQRRVNGLKFLQSKHSELESKFQEEVLALEKKYLELYRPYYEKRAEVISGKYEPTAEEVAIGEKVDAEDEEEEEKTEKTEKDDEKMEEEEEEKVAGIPEFWLTALKTHPQISETISEEDCEALKHLVDIRMKYLEKPGFSLEFEFTENDFFTNKVLSKSYYYQETVTGGDFVYDHAKGCEVEWKEGKDLTVTVETKKQRHKNTNKTRVVKRTVPAETFFNFFNPPVLPEDSEELDEEEAEGLDAKLEADYEIGNISHMIWFDGRFLTFIFLYFDRWGIQGKDHPPCRRLLHWQGSWIRRFWRGIRLWGNNNKNKQTNKHGLFTIYIRTISFQRKTTWMRTI